MPSSTSALRSSRHVNLIANLPAHRYFSSRPDLLATVAGGGAGGGASGGRAALAAAQGALANPGVHDAVNKWRRPSPDASVSGPPVPAPALLAVLTDVSQASTGGSDGGMLSGAGRVAAAAAALRSNGFSPGQNAASPPPAPAPGPTPRPPPRRSPSMASSASEEAPAPQESSKLVTQRVCRPAPCLSARRQKG